MKIVDGFVIVFSIASYSSFLIAKEYYEYVMRTKEALCEVPIIIVGNKKDRERERQVSTREALEWANEINTPYIETSAQNNDNVNEMFFQIAKMTHEWKVKYNKFTVPKKTDSKTCKQM